jgi:PAS domain S-box-containing protein
VTDQDDRAGDAANLRRRAEESIGKTPFSEESFASLSPEEGCRVLEELRVHQIELEMQNEELRRAQMELDVSRARYFDLYDLAPVGYCTVDGQGLIQEANLTSSDLMGIARGAMLKLPLSQFIVRQDQDIYYLNRKLLVETNNQQSCDLRMQRQDGTVLWAHLVMNSEPGSDGEPVCRIVIVDITERKQVEEALREKEEELQTIFEEAPVSMFILNQQGKINRANALACLFNKSRDGAVLNHRYGDVVGCFSAIESTKGHATNRMMCRDCAVQECSVEHMVADSFQTGQSFHQVEVSQCLRIDGKEQALKLLISTSKIMVGSCPMVVLTIQDITSQKLLEEKFRQSQKMESLGILAGGVAHEMNNVLGAILSLASINVAIQPPDTAAYRAFDIITQAATRGKETVKSLLNFARKRPEKEEVLDLNAVLVELTHLLEHVTLARTRIDIDLEPGLLPMRGDANALSSAFMNLCINAFDAMPNQGTLTLRSRNVDKNWIEVSVKDTGTGMSKEVLEKALDPFFSTKEVGKGTGLGLSTTLSAVAYHRGLMEIQSELGQGTRIVMRFPVCDVAAPPREPAMESASESSTRSLTVLVVDDDVQVQDAMREILQLSGHSSYSAFSGLEARAKMEKGLQPDVIILDLNMPGLGGAETLPLLRALQPNVPVILCTGRDDEVVHSLVASHPGVTSLPKPYDIRELQQVLRSICRR